MFARRPTSAFSGGSSLPGLSLRDRTDPTYQHLRSVVGNTTFPGSRRSHTLVVVCYLHKRKGKRNTALFCIICIIPSPAEAAQRRSSNSRKPSVFWATRLQAQSFVLPAFHLSSETKAGETAHWYLSVQKLGVPFLYLHQNTEQYSHSQDPASVIVTKQSHEAPKGIVAPNLANKAG
ncbi:hypothetical protein PG990_012678 [Apiospora arundinis]